MSCVNIIHYTASNWQFSIQSVLYDEVVPLKQSRFRAMNEYYKIVEVARFFFFGVGWYCALLTRDCQMGTCNK